jgi:oligosaccharide repeat unit polymerase
LWSKNINGDYTNSTLIFIAFSTLYGISGPINVVWGDGLNRLFSTQYNTSAFLISYAIANIGLINGITIYNLVNKNDNLIAENSIKTVFNNRKELMNIGLFLAAFASLFELINLLRIGGIEMLTTGKAIYQSSTSELTLTLPSYEIMILAFSLVGLFLGVTYIEKSNEKGLRFKILLFLMYSTPFLLIKTILGQRGTLLKLFFCIFIGITYFKPIKKIKPKLIIILLIVYVFLAFLFANREIVYLIPDNPNSFFETAFNRERIVNALNPGANEFGAAFGNYSEYYNEYNSKFSPKLGETYIKGLVVPIPSFIYPGEKPKQITYEFRDEFFLSEASRGAIAGTGFSSILEAYMNFNYYGVFFIYVLVGYFLQKIDKVYRNKSLFLIILYTTSISLTISFHRSAFGLIFANIFLESILIFLIITYLKFKRKYS